MQDMVRKFDRGVEDMGNVVGLEHVNTRVPCQQAATLFYVAGLGLTRDPYLMTGTNNMWINAGKSQFHLPTGKEQVLNGTTGLVIPGKKQLLDRMRSVRDDLAGTKFSCRDMGDHVAVTCPWGNKIRIHEPGPHFGNMQLGMPYVELDVPRGTAEGIVRFYQGVIGARASLEMGPTSKAARVCVGTDQHLYYREGDVETPAYDGHHIAIYIVDFSGPYGRLLDKGFVSQEDDQHQYRFKEMYDPRDGRVLFTLEHEVRSLRHPLYARPFVNRNPMQSNRNFAPGWEQQSWATPLQ